MVVKYGWKHLTAPQYSKTGIRRGNCGNSWSDDGHNSSGSGSVPRVGRFQFEPELEYLNQHSRPQDSNGLQRGLTIGDGSCLSVN